LNEITSCPANKRGTWLYKANNRHSYNFIYVNDSYLSSLIALFTV